MTKAGLLSIPQELLIWTLANLDAVALTRCAMTCRRIYETLKNSFLLKYTIQLHFNGVTDFGTSLTQRLSYPELIERLQRRRHEWLSPKWIVNVALDMEDYYQPFDFVGGALVRRSTSHLEITTLSIAGTNVNEHTIIKRVLKDEFPVQYFTMDPTQDVIVLIEEDEHRIPVTDTRIVRIHIRTLSNDDPHPLAQQTSLRFTVVPNGESNDIHDVRLEIARNTLVVHFYTSYKFRDPKKLRVLVWDWTTSELILDFSNSLKMPFAQFVKSDFGLLDSTYYFFASTSGCGSIQLCKFARSRTSNASATQHLATLHLPLTIPHVKVKRICTHAGPIEAHPLPNNTPFMVNDDDRLHVFTIDYFYANPDAGRFQPMPTNLFVHQRVFTKYCVQRRQHAHGDAPLDISWEEWGPSNTRIVFPSCTDPKYSRYVHGQRVVCHRLRSYRDIVRYTLGPKNTIVVLDFSPATVLSVVGTLPMPSSSNSKSKPGSLLPPSKISHSQVQLYKDDVETRLPCVLFTANLEKIYRLYMIHADGVVGVNADDDTETLLLEVYTI